MRISEEEQTLLKQTFLFRNCDLSGVAELLDRIGAYRRSFSRHEVIYSDGDFRRELGILLKGRVRVTKDGGSLVVSELIPGDLFGAAALFNKEAAYVSTLETRTDTEVLFLTQDAVRQLINESETVRENYLTYLSERIRFLSGKVDSLASGSGLKKLALFLLKNADESGSVLLPCSMSELAARLDTSRASLYRDMDHLTETGVISREGKRIRILREDQLTKLYAK